MFYLPYEHFIFNHGFDVLNKNEFEIFKKKKHPMSNG